MSRAIDVKFQDLKFPPSCAVCLSPAARSYSLKRVFSYGRGRRSFTVKIDVPMCELHFAAALYRSPIEKLAGWLALILSIVTGSEAAFTLLRYWSATGQGSLVIDLLAGGVISLGIFLLVWVILITWLVPLAAAPESKKARDAVRIVRFGLRDQLVRLMIANDQLAEMIVSESRKTAA